MSYSRTLSDEHKRKISNSLKGRKLTTNHKEAIGKAIKERWAQIPIDPQNTMHLDCCIDENDNLRGVYFKGVELPMN